MNVEVIKAETRACYSQITCVLRSGLNAGCREACLPRAGPVLSWFHNCELIFEKSQRKKKSRLIFPLLEKLDQAEFTWTGIKASEQSCISKKAKKTEFRQMGSRAVFSFCQKFFMNFNNIDSPKIVNGCPDHFREQRTTWNSKESFDPNTRSFIEQAKGSREVLCFSHMINSAPLEQNIQNPERGHQRAYELFWGTVNTPWVKSHARTDIGVGDEKVEANGSWLVNPYFPWEGKAQS